MALAQSKVTSQGQISIPLSVRQKLGVGPGSTLEWIEEDGKIVVKRKAQYTLEDLRAVLFPNGAPKRKKPLDAKTAIRNYIRKRYGRH